MGGQGYGSFSTSNLGSQETASFRPSLEMVKPAREGWQMSFCFPSSDPVYFARIL